MSYTPWSWADEEAYAGPLGDPDEGKPDPSEYYDPEPRREEPRREEKSNDGPQ